MNSENKGLALTITATLCAAAVPLLSKLALVYASSPLVLILRMLFAAFVSILIIKFWLKIKLEINKPSLLVALFGALNFSFFIFGIKFMPTVFAPVFYSSVPIQTTILAWLLFRDRMSNLEITGVVIGLIGSLIIFSNNFSSADGSKINIWGFIFLTLASMSIAMYGLLIDRLKKKLASVFSVSFYSILIALLISLPVGWLYTDSFILNKPFDISFWVVILSLAIFGTVMQYVLYQKSIQTIGKTASVIFFYLQPVLVVVLSALFLKESIDWISYMAGVLMVLIGSSLNLSIVRENLRSLGNIFR